MQIWTGRKVFEAFEYYHSKGIQSIRIQIRSIRMQIRPFERTSIHSNENFNH